MAVAAAAAAVVLLFLARPVLPARVLQEMSSSSGEDLIATACSRAKYADLCKSTLRSSPGSAAADLTGLAVLSLDLAIVHANETASYVADLKGHRTEGDAYDAACLDDCSGQYADAADDLRDAKGALRGRDFDTVNSMVSGAMSDAETCEDGFGDRGGGGGGSPLTQRNQYFHMLCSNSLAITGLLVTST